MVYEARLKSEIQSLVFLNELVRAAPKPIYIPNQLTKQTYLSVEIVDYPYLASFGVENDPKLLIAPGLGLGPCPTKVFGVHACYHNGSSSSTHSNVELQSQGSVEFLLGQALLKHSCELCCENPSMCAMRMTRECCSLPGDSHSESCRYATDVGLVSLCKPCALCEKPKKVLVLGASSMPQGPKQANLMSVVGWDPMAKYYKPPRVDEVSLEQALEGDDSAA
ncbi:hypothetical protein V8G54_027000 [Vigna mungo]|uniref:Uncharacterized protein n=1 Tax=Vigna mungo TaxID=3915 RepID=A0AAQ3RQZ0_VIGMU